MKLTTSWFPLVIGFVQDLSCNQGYRIHLVYRCLTIVAACQLPIFSSFVLTLFRKYFSITEEIVSSAWNSFLVELRLVSVFVFTSVTAARLQLFVYSKSISEIGFELRKFTIVSSLLVFRIACLIIRTHAYAVAAAELLLKTNF